MDEFGILLWQKLQRSMTERKNCREQSVSTTAQTYWQSSAENGNTVHQAKVLKCNLYKDTHLASPLEETWGSRSVPNLLPYTGIRAVVFAVMWVIVKKVCCEFPTWRHVTGHEVIIFSGGFGWDISPVTFVLTRCCRRGFKSNRAAPFFYRLFPASSPKRLSFSQQAHYKWSGQSITQYCPV